MLNCGNNRDHSRATGYGESMLSICLFQSFAQTDHHSRRELPWKDDPRIKRTKIGNWITFACIVIGLGLSGYIAYTGVNEAKVPEGCLIMDDNFEKIDPANWGYEIQVSNHVNIPLSPN